MIRSIYFSTNGIPQRNITHHEIINARKDKGGLLWVNLEQPDDQELHDILGGVFQFHPLTIEDCHSNGFQTSKIDDFDNYIFMIFHTIKTDNGMNEIITSELNIFLGDNFVVTSHMNKTMPPVEKTWKMLELDERLHLRGSDFLCHAILDVLVDDYMPILDQMDEEIEWLEDRLLAQPRPEILARLLTFKHIVMSLRRIISPQREVVNRLSRDEFSMIDPQSRIYFRDIYDHLVRIQDLSETIRDIVSGALDIYLNSTSLRLNEIMRALTVVSTIFLPLSFLAGVWGMNFPRMPFLDWQYGFAAVWGLFILIAIAMLWFFKKHRWF